MRRRGRNRWLVEAWAFLAVAVIAFVGGLLIGDLASSPKTETVYASESEGKETEATAPGEAPEASGEAAGGSQIFTGTGCGSCHALAAAGSTGTTGPDLNEFLAPDDTTAGVEEMILHPNLELAEGYPANVMPQNYGQTLSKPEVQELAEYLVANTPAKP
ncbi:MAG TPA: c-type cytochrome [Solirubrobacterales bacterium]|nr:c-type cytochrome [Solirubrobacterales bacterium]